MRSGQVFEEGEGAPKLIGGFNHRSDMYRLVLRMRWVSAWVGRLETIWFC